MHYRRFLANRYTEMARNVSTGKETVVKVLVEKTITLLKQGLSIIESLYSIESASHHFTVGPPVPRVTGCAFARTLS